MQPSIPSQVSQTRVCNTHPGAPSWWCYRYALKHNPEDHWLGPNNKHMILWDVTRAVILIGDTTCTGNNVASQATHFMHTSNVAHRG